MGPELVVRHGCEPELVVDVRAWGQGCMVAHRPRIGSEGRASCGWGQDWLCMVSGGWVAGVGLVVHGVRASM